MGKDEFLHFYFLKMTKSRSCDWINFTENTMFAFFCVFTTISWKWLHLNFSNVIFVFLNKVFKTIYFLSIIVYTQRDLKHFYNINWKSCVSLFSWRENLLHIYYYYPGQIVITSTSKHDKCPLSSEHTRN